MARTPARELEALRGEAVTLPKFTLDPGAVNPLGAASGEADITVPSSGTATEVTFTIRGVPLVYHVTKQELSINGHRASAPLQNGKLDVRVLVDRTAFEVFACGGLTYIPMPIIPSANTSVAVAATGGPATFHSLAVYRMKSGYGTMDSNTAGFGIPHSAAWGFCVGIAAPLW